MDCYSIYPRDWIFLKGYEFLFFAKNMGKSWGKNISKNMSGKCSQNSFDHARKSAIDAIKDINKTLTTACWKMLISQSKQAMTK